MTKPINLRKLVGAGLALMLSMALAACLVLPGKTKHAASRADNTSARATPAIRRGAKGSVIIGSPKKNWR